MFISDTGVRHVVTATADTTLVQAAELMRRNQVSDLLVVDRLRATRVQGILTDRDIVVAVVAVGLDPSVFTVGDIMSPELQTVREDCGVLEAVRQMATAGVRRLPVVSRDGALVGIVSADELTKLRAAELCEISQLINRDQRNEANAWVA